jgi:predicted XRE-type DNA-binding protein
MAAVTTTYHVTATPWEHGWELDIDGVGVTQSRSLGDAELMIRDLIARRTDTPAGEVEIAIDVDIPGLSPTAAEARKAVADAEEAQRTAAALSRAAANSLIEAGLSGRDVARVLKVSPQRVSQLVHSHGTNSSE